MRQKHGLNFVTHHETAAVGMADGYARLSGKIGLAATTQGPGYTNATTSLVSARLHRSPDLMLAGHASLRDPYNPQGMLDQHAMAKLTTGATVKSIMLATSITVQCRLSALRRRLPLARRDIRPICEPRARPCLRRRQAHKE